MKSAVLMVGVFVVTIVEVVAVVVGGSRSEGSGDGGADGGTDGGSFAISPAPH